MAADDAKHALTPPAEDAAESEAPAAQSDEHPAIQRLAELEAQLAQVKAGLLHSHRLATMGTLASMVAHEFNNLLTPIVSYGQYALKHADDTELLVKALRKSVDGALKAARVSSAILGFSRDDESDGNRDESADLRTSIDDSFACLAREPEKDGINLKIDVPNATIAMPALHLQQVLTNLISNALKVLGRGNRLSIRGRLDRDQLLLEVADSGPGIPEAIRDRVFDPFVTCSATDGADGEPRKGTGLGLCICRDLVQQAGGDIRVETATDAGTTFFLRLPLKQANALALTKEDLPSGPTASQDGDPHRDASDRSAA